MDSMGNNLLETNKLEWIFFFAHTWLEMTSFFFQNGLILVGFPLEKKPPKETASIFFLQKVGIFVEEPLDQRGQTLFSTTAQRHEVERRLWTVPWVFLEVFAGWD